MHEGSPVRDYVRRHAFEFEGDVVRPNASLAEVYDEARARNRRYGRLLFEAS